jgi:hypothetical protein
MLTDPLTALTSNWLRGLATRGQRTPEAAGHGRAQAALRTKQRRREGRGRVASAALAIAHEGVLVLGVSGGNPAQGSVRWLPGVRLGSTSDMSGRRRPEEDRSMEELGVVLADHRPLQLADSRRCLKQTCSQSGQFHEYSLSCIGYRAGNLQFAVRIKHLEEGCACVLVPGNR